MLGVRDVLRAEKPDMVLVQEEAPSFNKPVLVMRETTERPEAVDAGTALLVGIDKERIISETERLLVDRDFSSKWPIDQIPMGMGRLQFALRKFSWPEEQRAHENYSMIKDFIIMTYV